jgi:hypothetical protein
METDFDYLEKAINIYLDTYGNKPITPRELRTIVNNARVLKQRERKPRVIFWIN